MLPVGRGRQWALLLPTLALHIGSRHKVLLPHQKLIFSEMAYLICQQHPSSEPTIISQVTCNPQSFLSALWPSGVGSLPAFPDLLQGCTPQMGPTNDEFRNWCQLPWSAMNFYTSINLYGKNEHWPHFMLLEIMQYFFGSLYLSTIISKGKYFSSFKKNQAGNGSTGL